MINVLQIDCRNKGKQLKALHQIYCRESELSLTAPKNIILSYRYKKSETNSDS